MKITVPDSLADISVKQYKLLAEIEFKEDSTEWIIESISLLCAYPKNKWGLLRCPKWRR